MVEARHYYNLNLLAFLNLYDFADEPAMRTLAKSMLDLFLLDQALDVFAGATVGASRRTYAAYRIDTRLSPTWPLHHVYFGGGRAGFNLNFIGGVLAAATSSYRPGPVITWIATNRSDTFSHRATHTVGQFSAQSDHLSKHSWRGPEVLMSVLNSPGEGERSTEQVVQVTLGEEALVFVNQPSLVGDTRSPEWPPERILTLYRRGGHADPPLHPLWVPANAPPGSPGDTRPGYWQGNHFGPRSYGEGRLAFLIYRIGASHLPQPHVWLPRHAFDEVRHEGPWIFARKDGGYVGLWIPEGYHWTATGTWAGREIMCHGPRSAVLILAGRARTLQGFQKEAYALAPSWNADALRLSATSLEDGVRIDVEYEGGPRRNGAVVSTKGPRLGTPWGTLPLGEDRFVLRTPAGDLAMGVDLPPLSWTSRVTRRVERVLAEPGILVTWLQRKVLSLLGR